MQIQADPTPGRANRGSCRGRDARGPTRNDPEDLDSGSTASLGKQIPPGLGLRNSRDLVPVPVS